MENYKIVLLNGEELIPSENLHFCWFKSNGKVIGGIHSLMDECLIDYTDQIRETQVSEYFARAEYFGLSKSFGNSECSQIFPKSAIKKFVLL
jgi:hypothetical protein